MLGPGSLQLSWIGTDAIDGATYERHEPPRSIRHDDSADVVSSVPAGRHTLARRHMHGWTRAAVPSQHRWDDGKRCQLGD